MTASSNVLTVDGGSVTYPNGTVGLKPTHIEFQRGDFNVLLGPSGAGKSTLLRSLNGLVALSTGDIRAEGIGSLRERAALRAQRRQTGMVFQQHQLIGRLTVLANVLIGRLGYHSTLRALLPLPVSDQLIALDALDRVGMLDTALKRADQLSGGQQQRVGIARALAQHPRIILADEPVASLDPATASRVLDLMRGVCKDAGITAIVSLHQVELARAFADRVIGISCGAVVFDAAPAALDDGALATIYGSAPVNPPARPRTHSMPVLAPERELAA